MDHAFNCIVLLLAVALAFATILLGLAHLHDAARHTLTLFVAVLVFLHVLLDMGRVSNESRSRMQVSAVIGIAGISGVSAYAPRSTGFIICYSCTVLGYYVHASTFLSGKHHLLWFMLMAAIVYVEVKYHEAVYLRASLHIAAILAIAASTYRVWRLWLPTLHWIEARRYRQHVARAPQATHDTQATQATHDTLGTHTAVDVHSQTSTGTTETALTYTTVIY